MAEAQRLVTIKGVKDGLVFVLDDRCDFEEMLAELVHKMETTHQKILTGPIVHVRVKLGGRQVGDADKERIRDIIGIKGNLFIQSIESDPPAQQNPQSTYNRIQVLKGIVRSGQMLSIDGNLLYLGDVNPGGGIVCTGDIYVMGSLRGMAHAGVEGNHQSVIAASHLRPTQLRIADVISRPPEEWGIGETFLEFAYLKDGKMEIDHIQHLHRIRPESDLRGV